MTPKMAFTFCSGLAALTLAAALIPPLSPTAGDAQEYADGAFRDGVYQATVEFTSGRQPRLAAARWNTEKDRFTFASGYRQQWRSLSEKSRGKVGSTEEAQLTGYWDGLVEGASDGRNFAGFPPAGAARAQEAARIHSATFNESDKHHYLESFSAGYKLGYFAQHEGEEATLTSQRF